MSSNTARADRNEYDWNTADLKAQLDIAAECAWLPLFDKAARLAKFPTFAILALGSRETGVYWHGHPDGKIIGDHGHAFGLLQVNDESHHAEAHGGLEPEPWDPEYNLITGAGILRKFTDELARKRPPVLPGHMNQAAYCAYNRGVNGAYKSWQQYGNANKVTAHGNYGADCELRARVFEALLMQRAVLRLNTDGGVK